MNQELKEIYTVSEEAGFHIAPKEPESKGARKLAEMKAAEAKRMQEAAAAQWNIDVAERAAGAKEQLRTARGAAQKALGIEGVPMGPRAKRRNLEALQNNAVEPLGYSSGQAMRKAAEAEKPGRMQKAYEYLLRLTGLRPEESNDTEQKDRLVS